tara:strand:+ start:127 stop:591 length:465 start_codon:yes stop_codon:yes gene_type:complete
MPRSGYGARTSQVTSGDSCEDWYGVGDKKCPNRYVETGDLKTDIELLKKWVAFYPVGSWWKKLNSDELERKQAELNIITKAEDKERERERLAREKIEIAQDEFLARIREEIIRTSAKPTKPAPEVIPPEVKSYSPLIIGGVIVIVIILFLRRRA